ncbi:MAG: MBL fold metallo-hydrolase [Thermofilum sp.]|jgi:L-ascorbate metabolism protein UlaG (beta-lactamase superfamily)|nr:MBL fold metallo-hydrolase [Thermofilum sp.]
MGRLEYSGIVLERLSHAAFRVSGGGKVVYIDPFRVARAPRDGDIVVCTHDHYDHCSPEDISKVAKPSAVIVASVNCEKKVKGLGYSYKLLRPGDSIVIQGVELRAVPAYNVQKSFHPREYQGIGVLVKLAGVTIYHAGDTDYIPEMERLRGSVDIALLPVSGVYVMDAREAAKAALAIEPKVAVPMHYGEIVGSERDAESFRKALEGKIRVEIL